MSASSLMGGLAAGASDAFARVLQNCRFEGFGGDAYGGEDIQALFRRRPVVARASVELEAAEGAAFLAEDESGAPFGLFADLNAGWVTRLWRLGPVVAAAVGSAPTTSVPLDLDLDQRGGRLAFDPRDHRHLAPSHAAEVAALGERWLREAPEAVVGPLGRARPMILRAVSQGGRAAALVRLEGARQRGLAGCYALAVFEDGTPRIAVDTAGLQAAMAAPWSPVLR